MSFIKTMGISLLMIFTLTSCSRYIGYGIVMVPSEESELESGTLIKITKESRIRDTWVYNSPEEDHIEIDKWRVEFFKKKEGVDRYIKKYQEYKNYFVIVNRNGHNMRQNHYANANLVYKLKLNQKVKVIGRTEEKESIAKFNGYWWELITDDGVKGWSYDSYLSVYNGDELIHGRKDDDGPEIHDFFKKTWRPAYFRSMIESRNINLDRFKSKFKLIPDLDNKKITISTPNHYITENFTEINKTGTYNYELEGSSINLDFSRKGSVYVSYTHNFKSYNSEFVHIKDSVISEILGSETSKRKVKFSEFVIAGPQFKSKAYGEITFSDGNQFTWINNKNLKSKQLLTSTAGSEGTVSFKVFLGKSLIGSYDGVITFDFGSRQELNFLYSFESDGIRFLYIPENKIEKSTINSDNFFTPIQMYFTGIK